MQLAILCGGLAKRLGAISASTPKSLMDINGRPLLDLILEESREAGFDRFVLLAGHLSEKFNSYKSICSACELFNLRGRRRNNQIC